MTLSLSFDDDADPTGSVVHATRTVGGVITALADVIVGSGTWPWVYDHPRVEGVYEQHYRSEVMVTLRQVPGFRGARLRRTVGDETEFVSLTSFDDLDAIRSFAGSDYETAFEA